MLLSFFIVARVQLSPFPPTHSFLLHPLPHPTPNPTPLWLCPRVLYTCSFTTLPLFSPIIPLPPPHQLLSVLYFNVSGYILLACLLLISGERQIPYDLTYKWKLIDKTSKRFCITFELLFCLGSFSPICKICLGGRFLWLAVFHQHCI